MAHIRLYKNNPTAGALDGTEVSSGDGSLPLTFALNAGEGESAAQKAAVRCDAGYSIEGGCEIYLTGSTVAKWALATDDESFSDASLALTFGNWSERLTLEGVATGNAVFWVKASSSSDEQPQNDTSVTLNAEGIVVELDG